MGKGEDFARDLRSQSPAPFGCLPTILAVWVLWNHDVVGAFLLRLVTGLAR